MKLDVLISRPYFRESDVYRYAMNICIAGWYDLQYLTGTSVYAVSRRQSSLYYKLVVLCPQLTSWIRYLQGITLVRR